MQADRLGIFLCYLATLGIFDPQFEQFELRLLLLAYQYQFISSIMFVF